MLDIAGCPEWSKHPDVHVLPRSEVIRRSTNTLVKVKGMCNTCIGHCKVPELHWHMRNRGDHGNVCLESYNADCSSYNADCSLSDAVGMCVTRCSMFKSVSVSVSGAKRSKFFRTVVGLCVMPDEAINPRGIVVPLEG